MLDLVVDKCLASKSLVVQREVNYERIFSRGGFCFDKGWAGRKSWCVDFGFGCLGLSQFGCVLVWAFAADLSGGWLC